MNLPFITLVAILTSCSTSSFPTSKVNVQLSSWPTEFSLESSLQFKERIIRQDNSIAYITFDKRSVRRVNSDISIELFPPITQTPACKAEALGIHPSDWKTRTESEDSVHWGRVTYWNNDIPGGLDEMPSRICVPPNYNSEEWSSREPNQFVSYALCSEKDGKRVVVCVQQMTDNPKLAEEIFSTFRWTH